MGEDFAFLGHAFEFPGPVQNISSLGSGHIHDTYLVTCSDALSSKFVLQKFNQKVFKNPQEVMSNIAQVLDHLNKANMDDTLQPLYIIKSRNGELIYQNQSGSFWRVYNFIDQSDSFDKVTHPNQALGAAKAFGRFFRLVSGLNPENLFTTIPDFHHLTIRFQQLKQGVDKDAVGKVNSYKNEIEFALSRGQQVAEYSKLIDNNLIPTRVTHNDTKINNVLFKRGTTQSICVVDLDTIMPGLLLYDFGDMGRTFCNSVLEEGKAEDAIFRIDIFQSLCEGFFSTIGIPLTKAEVESLKVGPWWMTYIMGIRFLTDFLSGDVYYKIGYDRQNLDRARNQFHLVADIEKKQQEIGEILDASIKKYTHS